MDLTNTLQEYSNKIRYFNYSKRTNEIYTHISTHLSHKINLPI